jgi:transposase-like protein
LEDCVYTLEQRTRAVEPCIKHGLKATTTIRELGHPSRVQLAAWHREWLETGGSLHERSRASEAYSAEQRRAAVDHYPGHGRCNAHARRELGYPKSYQKLADWIEELAPGERRTTEPGTFAPGQRQRAVTALVGRAGSAREIADEAGSSRCTLYKWKRELLGEGPDMTEAKHDAPAQGAGDGDGKAVRATRADIDALEARKRELVEGLRRLEPGRDVMGGALGLLGKGAGADPANEPANREKTLLVESLRPKWGLSGLLRALGMARSSHQCQPEAMRSPDGDAEAREMVCAVFDANDGTYGRRRTRDEPEARGHVVGERRIRRIMAEEGPGAREGEAEEGPRLLRGGGLGASRQQGRAGLRGGASQLPVARRRDAVLDTRGKALPLAGARLLRRSHRGLDDPDVAERRDGQLHARGRARHDRGP